MNEPAQFVRTAVFIIKLILIEQQLTILKGIVSPDWKGLQMVSLDRFEV
jgi:hypothetical protein